MRRWFGRSRPGDEELVAALQAERDLALRIRLEDLDGKTGADEPLDEVAAIKALVILLPEVDPALFGLLDAVVLVSSMPALDDRHRQDRDPLGGDHTADFPHGPTVVLDVFAISSTDLSTCPQRRSVNRQKPGSPSPTGGSPGDAPSSASGDAEEGG